MNNDTFGQGADVFEPDPERPLLDERFDAFLRKHKDDFYRTAVARLVDPYDADEALSDACLVMYQRWEKIQAHPKPVVLARYILKCKIQDFHRARARRAGREEVFAHPPEIHYLQEMGEQDLLSRALEALREISPQQADCWEMYKVLGKEYSEIAEELDITIGAAKTAASRGQAKLRMLLTLESETKDS
ncbi:sigma-70 family RNA polymerase sigma factor [Streptomyces sp. SR27]|uniref:RNA polymerase sigma factor n=1 Tax=Streptomyces sp. SR27 TaxID=3076630 RepID=UPI00295BDCA4|nr:sigma-70 family RNA polymerase sigma factor [Streptomyces sp. SR27]MDV9186837.1 sigma-70 family RNA polymerase sigma factor [Streptomyces sp. SR27]